MVLEMSRFMLLLAVMSALDIPKIPNHRGCVNMSATEELGLGDTSLE